MVKCDLSREWISTLLESPMAASFTPLQPKLGNVHVELGHGNPFHEAYLAGMFLSQP
jgi:hypothetical protein